MLHRVQLEGFEGQTIEVAPPGFNTAIKLLVNGQPVPDGPKRGQMLLRRNDGREVTASWKAQAFGFDTPALVVEDKTIPIVEPLKTTQWIWSGLPLVLIAVGGALGAIAGIIAFTINIRIFRLDMNILIKFLLTGLISFLAALVYYIGVLLLTAALGH